MISRKKLLEELEAWKERLGVSSPEVAAKIMIKAFIDKVNAQPEEDVTDINVGNKWIPVSERLPENADEVHVTLTHTYDSIYRYRSIARHIKFDDGECHWCDNKYGYLEWDKYSDGRGGNSSYKVIAWQPLSEPYKGE